MTMPRNRIKSEKASLIGGIVVGIATMVLWEAITHELKLDGKMSLAAGLLVSAGVAIWIWVADL